MTLELVQDEMPIGLNLDALEEWQEYREFKKKPLSELALKKVRNKLMRHSMEHQQYMVDQAIENDWQGLHEIEPRREQTTRQQSLQQDLTDRSWAK